MSKLNETVETINEFFDSHPASEMDLAGFARFCANILGSTAVDALLEEVSDNTPTLDDIAVRSYQVSPSFTKMMLHKDTRRGWGMRIHLFDPIDESTVQEPWHEHRWHLASSVVAGTIHSQNGRVEGVVSETESAYYRYAVGDKYKTGAVTPRYTGRCVVRDSFGFSVTAGTTYAQHVDLAHALTLSEPSVSAVITAPDSRQDAAFIETLPLRYAQRPLPAFMTADSLLPLIERTRTLIHDQPVTASIPRTSPQPDMLTSLLQPAPLNR